MFNLSTNATTETIAGCDVSADWLDVACQRPSREHLHERRFDNTPSGHQRLIKWLCKGKCSVRIAVEASGVYSLDLALALHETKSVKVMIAHPRALKDYRRAQMQRSKTDQIDARLLCDYCLRMPFIQWQPPADEVFELRALARRLEALVEARIAEMNRLHAASKSRIASRFVINDINIRHLERRMTRMEDEALTVIERHADLEEACSHLRSVSGIAERSAIKLLGEILTMPEGLSVREWVAFAGLDVRHHDSGRSVHKPGRISKEGNVRLRRALYMPAQVAIQHEPNVRAFYDKLRAKGKKPMVAIVAVMRKLLHAIYGMLKHGQDFDGQKFYRLPAQTA
ncbi:MAG TPA: IS110 family transposase [Rhodothermales bacterium]|nr:IS110 family transposase [Rhodothermales bacterium]